MADKKPILPALKAEIAKAEAKYGDLPKGLLEQFAGVESDGGRNLVNPKSSARGPFQFMKDTGPEFGLVTEADRMDFVKSTDAAARLLLRNKKDLEKRIGRPATNGELYLAHQQGAAGAAKLLNAGDKLAADIVDDPERVRLNGGDPKTMTAKAFAAKWTSKFDGGAATAPAKKPDKAESALASFVGETPQPTAGGATSPDQFYNYNPARLEQLKESNRQRGGIGAITPDPVVPKAAIKPVNKINGSLLAQTNEEVAAGEAEPVVKADRKSTAILQGLSVMEKSMQRLAPELLNIEAAEAPVTAPEGIAGIFSRAVDAGLANAAADREYFGAIIDSITGQPDKAAGRIRDARLREAEAEHHTAGMESFEDFIKAPTIDGFFGQVVRSMGEVAPSAVETAVSALVTGGTYSFAKLGLSQGSKAVTKMLVKDLVEKKVRGELKDAGEAKLLDALFDNFKKGAMAGAFGQEYVPAAGGAFAEFGEAGLDMDANAGLVALGIAVPQAAIGAGGEAFILKGLSKLAFEKSTREAGDSVLKRYAADVAKAAMKSGATEGLTEVAQEGISVGQRMAIDPEYSMEDAQLRIAQAAFSGFFGGGALGGGGAIPAAGISAVRSEKVGGIIDKAMKKAKSIIKDASDARVESEVNAETKGADDESVMTGRTAPEPIRDFQGQIAELLNPKSPKQSVWATEQQDIGLAGMIPGEVSSTEESGKTLYVANLPGHGNLITTDENIANELMATYNSGGDVKEAIGLALDYKGKPGENVVQAKNKDGAVIHEQSFDDESRAAALATAQQMADAAGGTVEEKSAATALEERTAQANKEAVLNQKEVSAIQAFDAFMADTPDPVEDGRTAKPLAGRETRVYRGVRKKAAHGDAFYSTNPDVARRYSDNGEIEAFDLDVSDFEEYDAGNGLPSGVDLNSVKRRGAAGASFTNVADHATPEGSKEMKQVKDTQFYVPDSSRLKKVEQEKFEVKKMEVDDDGEATVEDTADTEADTTALEDQLNARYAELDAANATRIKQFNPRTPKLDHDEETAHAAKIEEAMERLARVVQDEKQFESYTKYADRMPLDMINKLIKLHESDDDSGQVYYDVASDGPRDERGNEIPGEPAKLSITQRDADPNSETTVTRDTVKSVLKSVASWSKSARHNGAVQIGQDGKLQSMGGSVFWLVNRRTGKALRLNGTPPKKGMQGFGQQGIGLLAKLGTRLNAQTGQGLEGDGLTNIQKHAQGFLTMWKSLMDAGYDLKIGTTEANLRPYTSHTKLPEIAQREVVLINKKGRAYTLPELMGAKAPFEASKSDFDANERVEQLSDEKERVTPSVNILSEGRVETRAPQEKNVDRNEERALKEAKQKKQGGFDAEEQDHQQGSAQRRPPREKGDPAPLHGGLPMRGPRVEAARSGELSANARERAIVEEAIEREMTEYVEDKLRDIPDDITIKLTHRKGMYQAELNSERFPRGNNIVEADTLENVVALAHAKANSKTEQRMHRYDRIGLDDAVHNTQQSRESIDEEGKANPKIVELAGVPTPKDQTKLKGSATQVKGPLATFLPLANTTAVKVMSNANSVKMHGKFGPMTNRVLGILLSKLTLQRPLSVMTLSHLKENFDALTAPGAPYANAKDALATTISDMEDNNEQGRVLMGNRYLVVLRNTPKLGLDSQGNQQLAPDDAQIAAVLGHEIGHILFSLEYEKVIEQGPLKSYLWEAYVRRAKQMGENRPSQYTATKEGFEEWFADQVMAWVYKDAQSSAKNAVDSFFKRIANAFRDMYHRVNAALGGRLQKAGGFDKYMRDVIQRHAANRKLNNDIPVATSMVIKSMNLNLASRIPAAVANRVRNAATNGGAMKKLGNYASRYLSASVDFMANAAHGPGGKALSKFFGTMSQSMDSPGWNKRKLFVEARYANEFAKIFGFNEKTPGKEWRSQRVTDILNEAEDDTIDTANLSTPEAVKVRELFERLYDDYLVDPNTGKTWFGNIHKMKNYGGPRMFNADKINQDPEAFVRWLQAHPTWGSDPVTIDPASGRSVSRAHAVVAAITGKIGEPIGIINAEIDLEIAQGTLGNLSPSERAAEIFWRSAEDRAVMEAKNKILRGAKSGKAGYTLTELLNDTLAIGARNASNATQAFVALRAARTAADPKVIEQALNDYWMHTTKETRLTPGMDPALSRTLPKIPTKDFRNATPGDPNGWLLPQATAIQQYFHFATRKVEYAKMGGFEYVSAQLDSIPKENQNAVDEAIMANLGKFGENMSNKWRLFNSAAAVATVFTTLLFTTLSSVTDFAGIATRSKDFRELGTYFQVLKKTLSDRDYAELALSVGTVVGQAQDHAMIGLGELDHANRTSRAIMDGFFKYTGLELFTRFSRTVATGMGKEFILNTANRADFGAREERYLAELGLTREDVQNWVADGYSFDTDDGRLVRDAIARFADEAIIRPDASQRPTWASNPYFSTVWQLKSYYYGFGKTVMGGLIRETQNRYAETGGDVTKALAVPALLAVTIFPLTMLGLGGREWAKYLFQLALPFVDETPFRTSYMDMGEYSWEIFKRSGVMGPFALALTTLEAFEFEGIAAPFTANIPLVDMVDDSVFDGDGARLLPVVNNVK